MRSELLSYDTIARSAGESIAPELWPDHAWVPALGCTGGVLPDVCGGRECTSAGPVWVPGAIGTPISRAYFGRESSFLNNLTGLTIVADVVQTSNSPYARICSARSLVDGIIMSRTDGSPRFFVATGGALRVALSTITIPLNKRGVQVGTWNGTTLTHYFDNVLLGSGEATGTYTNPARDYYIGAEFATDADWLGRHYSVAIYRRAISAEQIATISADPLLPFRRRRSVRYFLPSVSSKFFPHLFGRVA